MNRCLALLAVALFACSGPVEVVEAPVAPATTPAAVAAPERLADDATFTRWHEPIQANLFIAPRGEHLYIAWALPRDLMPLATLEAPEQVEPFLVNSAVRLCHLELGRATDQQTACMVHLLRLESNDEYTKSAAGGFGTVGRMELPLETVRAAPPEEVVMRPRSAVRASFSRLELDLAGFDLAAARAAAAEQGSPGKAGGPQE